MATTEPHGFPKEALPQARAVSAVGRRWSRAGDHLSPYGKVSIRPAAFTIVLDPSGRGPFEYFFFATSDPQPLA